MKARLFEPSLKIAAYAIASAFCVTSLAGCGATGNFTQGLGPETVTSGLSGKVHGGPNPVIGATVTLYATSSVTAPTVDNNYGYGQAGTVLGTTTTKSDGSFTLTGDAKNCPAGQQAYIVAAGGNTGSNSANSAALLMAALGPCSEISDSTQVIIDEPTTIAAAYALSGFMTVGGTDGTTVNISAPANNNAAQATCAVNGSKQTTGCVTSGLAHAFLNAANLVNSSTGAANSTLPNNANAFVPRELINTLANSVEACVNSNGDVTTPTAPCAILMANTANADLDPSDTVPTNTLQALLNLALYPSQATGCPTASASPAVLCAPGTGSGLPQGAVPGSAVASAATANLYNVANSNGYYSPALTVVPLDFTIGINYPTGNTMWSLGSDNDDNVYAYSNGTPKTIYAFTSNGTQSFAAALSAGGGCSSFGVRCAVATDTLGNVWVTDNAGLTRVSNAGVVGTTYTTVNTTNGLTVDMGNNVWLGSFSIGTGASGIEELVQGAATISDVNVNGKPEPYAMNEPIFDSAGNLWAESDNTAGSGGPGAILLISDKTPSSGSLTSPSFNTAGGGNGNPDYFTGGAGTPNGGTYLDGSGNLWFSAQNDLLEITSGGGEANGAQNYNSLAVAYGPIYAGGVERNSIMDGDGKIVVDATSTGVGYLSVYYPNAPADGRFSGAGTGDNGAMAYLNPCYIASGTTVCELQANQDGTHNGGQSFIVNNPRGSAVDSSGAIWSSFQSSNNVLQLIGPGAPSWSQRSYIPAALAPNLNGNATSLRPF